MVYNYLVYSCDNDTIVLMHRGCTSNVNGTSVTPAIVQASTIDIC